MGIVLIAVGVAVIAVTAALIGYSFGATMASVPAAVVPAVALQVEPIIQEQGETQATPEVRQSAEQVFVAGQTSIQGFDRLQAAGRRVNADGIYNHPQNNGYFIISFIMPDGSEIFRSGIIAPGQPLGDVELSKQLEPGIHEGVIARYSIYSLNTMQPLNGADITFTLEVLP